MSNAMEQNQRKKQDQSNMTRPANEKKKKKKTLHGHDNGTDPQLWNTTKVKQQSQRKHIFNKSMCIVLFQEENVLDALCPPMGEYHKVHRLLNENMSRGLAKDTHDDAQVPMYCTYVRDVPNGTGNLGCEFI